MAFTATTLVLRPEPFSLPVIDWRDWRRRTENTGVGSEAKAAEAEAVMPGIKAFRPLPAISKKVGWICWCF